MLSDRHQVCKVHEDNIKYIYFLFLPSALRQLHENNELILKDNDENYD